MKNRILTFLALAAPLLHACSHPSPGDPGTPVAASSAAVLAPATAPAAHADPIYRVPVEGLPSIGRPDALVTLVEFTDYQCPYCQKAEETIAKLRAAYPDEIRIVVAENPLPFHDRSEPTALAALAADVQGKFAPMHAALFAQKGVLDDGVIDTVARRSGLSMDRFDADERTAVELLGRSKEVSRAIGIKGTPTFFINGRRLVGAQQYDVFHQVVEERLTAARALLASGVQRADVYKELVKNGAPQVEEDAPSAGGAGCGGEGACDGKGDHAGASDKVETIPVEGAPSKGASQAKVTIVAFSDFECPFCARAEGTLKAVAAAHPGDVRVIFKNRPLPFHEHAQLAAKAALAADAQGKFWEYHDRLFAQPHGEIDRPVLDKIAADLKLDLAQFARDLADPALDARIARDQADADALHVEGTPTFFVNGRRVVGAQPANVFEDAIAKSRQ
ncbi:MAG TPA: thioredoxin domain-containing protein [Polyangiaceae bacterium]|jgi:protein-disulfide isomerase